MISPGRRGKHVIRWDVTSTRESEKSFLGLILPVMGKNTDLSNFGIGQIVISDGSE